MTCLAGFLFAIEKKMNITIRGASLARALPFYLISVTFPFLRVSMSPKHFTFMK